MSGLFGGSSNSVQQEVYSGIQVSTSLYGGCIPYIAGRQRVPSNLLWYGNFQVSTSNAGGGKGGGGGGTKQYSYSAAFVAGLCIGPIQGVHQIWHDKALVTLTFENLALALGSSGQPAWSGFPAGTPTVQQIPYDHIAYVASSAYNLGSSAAMPNLTFEVEGVVPGFSDANSIFDADPSAVIPDYLLGSVHGALSGYPGTPLTVGSSAAPLTGATNSYQAYCMAMGLLTSPYEDTQRQATDFISELLQCTNSQCRLSVGILEIIPYCDATVSATVAGTFFSYTPDLTPVFQFTDDDFCPEKDEPPVSLKQTPQSDTYNTVNVEYLDRTNYYNTATANCSDLNDIALNGPRLASSLSWHQVTSAQVAKTAGTLWLTRQLYEINSYTFKVRSDYALLEPLDYIAITDANLGLAGQVCQITEIEDDAENNLTITALELPGVTRTTAQYNWAAAQGYFANYATDPGPVQTPVIFVMPPIPSSLSEGITIGIAAAGSSSNAAWLGCDVYCSIDSGTTYQFVGTVPEACRYGTTTASLSAVADPDTTSTLSVVLADTQLQISTAVTHAEADSMQTLALVGTGSAAEVVSFGTAALVSAGAYNLSYLRRNLYGSANQAHASGVPFVRLDGAIFQIAVDPGFAGQTLNFKFVSFNTYHNYGPQTLSGSTAYSYTVPAALPVSGAVRLIPRGNCAFTGGSVYKNSGASAWDSDCVSANPIAAGNISAQYGAGGPVAVGFVTSTASTANPGTNMYAIDSANGGTGHVAVLENGTTRFDLGRGPQAGDLYDVRYDGFTLSYYINGLLVWSTPLQGASLFQAIAENTVGSVISDVQVSSGTSATPTEWVATGNCVVSNETSAKVGGVGAWDSCVRSIVGYPTCHITAKATFNTVGHSMIGLSKTPAASSSFTNMDYGWYHNATSWHIFESGTDLGAFGGAVSTTDVVAVVYNGSTISYILNGVVMRSVASVGFTLYGFCPFNDEDNINSLRFGPTTNLAVIDTNQVNGGAITNTALGTGGVVTLSSTFQPIGDTSIVVPSGQTWAVSVSATANLSIGPNATCNIKMVQDFTTTVVAAKSYSNFGSAAAAQDAAFTYTTTLTAGSHDFELQGINLSGGSTSEACSVNITVLKR